jgi:hypothetical protein
MEPAENDILTSIRSSLQPAFDISLNKKRDPAVIRNLNKSREVMDRRLSFFTLGGQTGEKNSTPNLNIRHSNRLSNLDMSEEA